VTEKQDAARTRNRRIWMLRGLYAQCSMLSPANRAAAQTAVDDELVAMGAEPEGVRQAERRAGR